MKKVIISIAVLFLVFVMFNFNVLFSVNYFDDIRNSDEYLIKAFRSHHNFSFKELKQLEINYLGLVDGFRIYFVPVKGSWISESWTKDGFTFPPASHTRIIGIKNGMLYTLGNLIHETSIDIKNLYELIQGEF